VLPTRFADQWAGRPEELATEVTDLGPTVLAAILSGRGHEYVPFAGQSVGLINDIRSARDIVTSAVAEAEQILSGLSSTIGPRAARQRGTEYN